MSSRVVEVYRPRAVSDLGVWEASPLQFKVYGLVAEGKVVSDGHLRIARSFLSDVVLPAVAVQGEHDGLGFLIVHPGSAGVSISAYWWTQGCVLCQRIHRQLHDDDGPLDMVARPVVACVWELALINAEQEIWRETMMTTEPDLDAYLASRKGLENA